MQLKKNFFLKNNTVLFHLGRIKVFGKLYRENLNASVHPNPFLTSPPSERMAYERAFQSPSAFTKSQATFNFKRYISKVLFSSQKKNLYFFRLLNLGESFIGTTQIGKEVV